MGDKGREDNTNEGDETRRDVRRVRVEGRTRRRKEEERRRERKKERGAPFYLGTCRSYSLLDSLLRMALNDVKV